MIQQFTVTQEQDASELANSLAGLMCDTGRKINRGWQSSGAEVPAYEMSNVVIEAECPSYGPEIAALAKPDMPWADEHFRERVAGHPVNPPPSYKRWPWHSQKHADDHISGKVFDHTYPERFWPKRTRTKLSEIGGLVEEVPVLNRGIRFAYGDLQDVYNLLKRDPFTRQAYLPVWFPEDTGATEGQRVPCTLGYHFIRNGTRLDMNYFIRSCDLTRHFRNDFYFALRLLAHMADTLTTEKGEYPLPGTLTMFVSNLHLFAPDAWRYQR